MYRTKTYIAADWSGDYGAVEQLQKWNDSNYWSLSFADAHDITQARDTSLNCSIKASLRLRLQSSKRFILIVGDKTKTVRSGSCQYCSSYESRTGRCGKGHLVDYKSYIEFECEKAIKDAIPITVLYNSCVVNKSKCPDIIKNYGKHAAMCFRRDGKLYWDYDAVKRAIDQTC